MPFSVEKGIIVVFIIIGRLYENANVCVFSLCYSNVTHIYK